MTVDHDGAHHEFDVGILGGGSGAEALVRELHGSGLSVVVFEEHRVGGECPFTACMPSKSMLHDARKGTTWEEAVQRRLEVTEGLDDTDHVRELERGGARLVRGRAHITGSRSIESGGVIYRLDHIVIATGSQARVPEDVAGLTSIGHRCWTSEDVLTTTELPSRLAIIGGGVIGSELSQMLASFGSTVHLIDRNPFPFDHLHPDVGEIVQSQLRAVGVICHADSHVESVRLVLDEVEVCLAGSERRFTVDRVIVAVGKLPRWHGIGLESLGVDPAAGVPVDQSGRVDVDGSVWAIGDAAGLGQYTHLANHHAAVVADRLGGGSRRFDDVVVPACVFTEPPIFVAGPSYEELSGDGDVVWATTHLDGFPRSITDDLQPGFLAVAARRSTGRVIAAHGIGPRFDEIVHALVVAIDGEVPVRRLRESMQPFPTVGEILGSTFRQLADRLVSPPPER